MSLSRAVGLCVAILLSLGSAGAVRAQASDEVTAAIAQYSAEYGVPEGLVHRIVKRESKYNPRAYHGGNWGLMQIKYATARTMGYRGPAKRPLMPQARCSPFHSEARRVIKVAQHRLRNWNT